MKEYREQFDRILNLLEEHGTQGLTVTAIAQSLGITRISAAKYLELMVASGDLSMERFGQKKLYRRTRRLPLPEVIDRLPNALVILDADLHVRMVNTSFMAMLRIQPNRNLVGVRIGDLNLPIFSEISVVRNIDRVRRGETFLDEMRLIDEYTDRVYHIDFTPIVSPAEGAGIMISLRDITDLRRAETALKDTERKMATLFETVPSGIVIFNEEGVILNANRAALKFFGLRTLEQLSISTIFNLPCTTEKMEMLITKGRPTEIDFASNFDRIRDEGVPTWKSGVAVFNVIFTPIRRDGGGPPSEFAILFKDITHDRQKRKDLTFRESRYRSLFENAANGVIIYETIGTGEGFVFKDLNHAAEQILGVQKEEVVGRSVYEIFPDLADRKLREMGSSVLHSDNPLFLPPLRYRKGYGPWIWHYLFRLPSGELASFMIDVSSEPDVHGDMRAQEARHTGVMATDNQ